MTVRDPAMKAARELRFEIFNGCFGDTSITPCDIDGMVEFKGRFLFIESKGRRIDLKGGQRRALIALSQQPRTTVLLIGGDDPNDPTVMQLYRDGKALAARGCTLADVRMFVARWFADVQSGLM